MTGRIDFLWTWLTPHVGYAIITHVTEWRGSPTNSLHTKARVTVGNCLGLIPGWHGPLRRA